MQVGWGSGRALDLCQCRQPRRGSKLRAYLQYCILQSAIHTEKGFTSAADLFVVTACVPVLMANGPKKVSQRKSHANLGKIAQQSSAGQSIRGHSTLIMIFSSLQNKTAVQI